jgi:hypothetical protein
MSSWPTISDDVMELFASGVDVYIATRSKDLVPESALGMGIRVHADRRTATVYVPDVSLARTLANLQEPSAPVALMFCHPPTNRSVQLKGHLLGLRPSTDSDREIQQIFRSALVASFAQIGIPRALTRGLPWWPSTAIDVEVEQVFKQTPGPDAGELLRNSTLAVIGPSHHG